MGVGVYVFAVFRGADSVRRGPWGLGFMCSLRSVGADAVRRNPWGSGLMCAPCSRGGRGLCLRCVPVGVGVHASTVFPWGSGFMCSLCFVGADSVRRGQWGSGFMCSLCSVGADAARRGTWGHPPWWGQCVHQIHTHKNSWKHHLYLNRNVFYSCAERTQSGASIHC